MSKTSHFVSSKNFVPTINNVTFGNPDWSSSGWGTVPIKFQGFDLLLKGPELVTPFGFSKGMPGARNYGRDFNLQFNLDPVTVKTQAFSQGYKDLEEVILRYAYDNRIEWGLFGNQRDAENATMEDIKNKFYPIVKPPKPGSRYPPTMKVGFRTYYNKDSKKTEINIDCRDDDQKEIEPSEETIPRFSKCIPVIRVKNICISPDGKFWVKSQIEKLRVYKPEPYGDGAKVDAPKTSGVMASGQCLLDDSDDED